MLYTHYTGSIDNNHYLHLHLNKTMHHEIHKKKMEKEVEGGMVLNYKKLHNYNIKSKKKRLDKVGNGLYYKPLYIYIYITIIYVKHTKLLMIFFLIEFCVFLWTQQEF